MFLNVFLNYVGIRAFGYQAAAYTTAFSYLVLMIMQAFMEKRLTGTQIIPLPTTLCISCAYFIICIVTMATFRFPFWGRCILALIAAPIALWYFLPRLKDIRMLMKKKK